MKWNMYSNNEMSDCSTADSGSIIVRLLIMFSHSISSQQQFHWIYPQVHSTHTHTNSTARAEAVNKTDEVHYANINKTLENSLQVAHSVSRCWRLLLFVLQHNFINNNNVFDRNRVSLQVHRSPLSCFCQFHFILSGECKKEANQVQQLISVYQFAIAIHYGVQ